MSDVKASWPAHRPEIGCRCYVTWHNNNGTVTKLPYGTCVEIRLDSGAEILLAGNDWSEAVEDGSLRLFREHDPILEHCLDQLRGDRNHFRHVLTDKDTLLAKVCEYAEYEAKRKRCEPWSIVMQIFGHGSGVASAIYELYRSREKDGGK